jgi:hypothetical protein
MRTISNGTNCLILNGTLGLSSPRPPHLPRSLFSKDATQNS